MKEFGKSSVDQTTIRLDCTIEPHPTVLSLIESLQAQVNHWNSSLIINIS